MFTLCFEYFVALMFRVNCLSKAMKDYIYIISLDVFSVSEYVM